MSDKDTVQETLASAQMEVFGDMYSRAIQYLTTAVEQLAAEVTLIRRVVLDDHNEEMKQVYERLAALGANQPDNLREHMRDVDRMTRIEERLRTVEAETARWECLDCKEQFDTDRVYAFSYCPKCHGGHTRRAAAPVEPTQSEQELHDALMADRAVDVEVYRQGEWVSHERAREAAQRFIDEHFRNQGRPRPQTRIPAEQDDDDLVLIRYIEQQRRQQPQDAACLGGWKLRQFEYADGLPSEAYFIAEKEPHAGMILRFVRADLRRAEKGE